MTQITSDGAAFVHGTPAKTAVVLINLGTPDAPTPAALKRYLRQFLSDPRVVDIPRLIWLPILHGIILNTRPKKSAAKYASIWTADGSPLAQHTAQQSKLLRGYLGNRGHQLLVTHAMRYGNPSIASVLEGLRQQNVTRILLVPLYPQYAASTSATAMDEAFRYFMTLRNQPEIRSVRAYCDHPGYVAAVAQSIRDYWRQNGPPETLVMSFHGLPKVLLERGDPYYCECQKSARLIATELSLPASRYRVSFQSQFGRAEWLKPSTANTLHELGRDKTRRVDVVCPGFSGDCLETLEEIAIEGKTDFLAAGGGEFHYIPCLNERPDWIGALADLVETQLAGWPTREPIAREALIAQANFARDLGARQ